MEVLGASSHKFKLIKTVMTNKFKLLNSGFLIKCTKPVTVLSEATKG
jgi:hypothetical protein